MMKGGLCWIRGLRGQEQDMSSLALEWNHFSSYNNRIITCSKDIPHAVGCKEYFANCL